MAATIETVTIGSNTEKGVVLRNSQIFRKIRDNSWSKLQLGMRFFFIDDPAAVPSAGAILSFGLCNGSSAGIGDATPKHCLAATTMSNLGAGVAWGRDASSGDYTLLTHTWTDLYRQRYVNGVRTSAGQWSTAAVSGGAYIPKGTSYIARCALLFSIERGSPNFTINIFGRNTLGTNQTLPTRAQFISQIEATSPSILSHTAGVSSTIGIDEATNGVLDHVNVWWNRSAPALFITDISVAKLS